MCETFPELAKHIFADLRKQRRLDLAEQVATLDIIGRCGCGLEACGTFYTELPGRQKPALQHGIDITLRCGATVKERGGTIVQVETLDPTVEAELRRLIP